MKADLPSARRLLSPVLLALFGMAPMGCAPEVTFCQVEGAKLENGDDTLTVWVNPILYVRVFNDELFETTNFRVTVLNGSEVVYPSTPIRFPNFTTDPGGTSVCPMTTPPPTDGGMAGDNTQRMTGIQIPRRFPRTARLNLSVKIDMSDTSGTARSFTLPVERIRYVQEAMPGFSCTPTRCGR